MAAQTSNGQGERELHHSIIGRKCFADFNLYSVYYHIAIGTGWLLTVTVSDLGGGRYGPIQVPLRLR